MSTQVTQIDEARSNLIDMYGAPVMEYQSVCEIWEGYVDDENRDRLLIAKFELHDDEWVKTGLESRHITDIHMDAYKLRKEGE